MRYMYRIPGVHTHIENNKCRLIGLVSGEPTVLGTCTLHGDCTMYRYADKITGKTSDAGRRAHRMARSNPILGQVLGHVDTRKMSGTKLSSKFSGTRPNRNALKGNGARIQARERLLTPSELGDRAIRPIFYKIPLPLPVTQRYSIRGGLINPPKKSMVLRFL